MCIIHTYLSTQEKQHCTGRHEAGRIRHVEILTEERQTPRYVISRTLTKEDQSVSIMAETLMKEEQPTLCSVFWKAAQEFPEYVAVVSDDGNTKERMTYNELLRKATQVRYDLL